MAFYFGTFWGDLFALLSVVVFAGVVYFKHSFTYWRKRGLKSLQPSIPFGNLKDVFLIRSTFGDFLLDYYAKLKSKGTKHLGMYAFSSPVYVPTDLEIIKHILTKDFQHFHDRNVAINDEDPLSLHLFALPGERWKTLRSKLSPTFTSGKMKMMFPSMIQCSQELKSLLMKQIGTPLNIKDVMARFGTDVIGSCAFGINCDSLKNPDVDFRKYGRRFFEPTFVEAVKNALNNTTPTLATFLKLRIIPHDVTNFFTNLVNATVKYREKHNLVRKDFIHLLIQLKNGIEISDEAYELGNIKSKTGTKNNFSMNELTAQSFVFFIAGFETSSTTLQFCMYELAQHKSIQDKLRKEVNAVLQKYNGELSYEAVMEMKYMDKVLNETLRKWPAVPLLNRVCAKDYSVPSSSLKLEKGTAVLVPILPIQMDPEYFPNPEKFDPERFNEEEKAKRHPYAFLPFGEGPRNCIGMRFGLMQAKVGLIALLRDFSFTLNHLTPSPMKMNPSSFVPSPIKPIMLNIEKL